LAAEVDGRSILIAGTTTKSLTFEGKSGCSSTDPRTILQIGTEDNPWRSQHVPLQQPLSSDPVAGTLEISPWLCVLPAFLNSSFLEQMLSVSFSGLLCTNSRLPASVIFITERSETC
jgi:hypothetical protein